MRTDKGTPNARKGASRHRALQGYKRAGLQQKLLMLLIPVFCIPIVLIAALNYYSMVAMGKNNVESMLLHLSQMAADSLAINLEGYRELAESGAHWMSQQEKNTSNVSYLTRLREQNDLLSVGIIHRSGNTGSGINHSSDPVFTTPRDTGETYMSGVYYDEARGKRVMSISAPIQRQGDFDGVVLLTVEITILEQLLEGLQKGTESSMMLVDSAGMCVASTNKILSGVSMQELDDVLEESEAQASLGELWSKMGAGGQDYMEYNYNGTQLAAYTPVENSPGWSLSIGISEDTVMQMVTDTSTVNIVTAGAAVIIVLIAVIVFSGSLCYRIGIVTNRLEAMSRGDLTSPVEPDDNWDEIGRLTEAAATLVNEFRGIVEDIEKTLSQIAIGNMCVTNSRTYVGDFAAIQAATERGITAYSKLLAKISQAANELVNTSDAMAFSAEGLSQGASQQASSVQELFSTISEISRKASSITNASLLGGTSSAEDVEGEVYIPQEATMDRLMLAMTRVVDTSYQIKEITHLLESLASETKILSLNASVEAARSGEAGKGFAVIAAEIRRLAAKSTSAVVTAKNQTEEIFEAVSRGQQMVSETMVGVSSIVVSLEQVREALSQISHVTEQTASTAEQAAVASEELTVQASLLKDMVAGFSYREQAGEALLSAEPGYDV